MANLLLGVGMAAVRHSLERLPDGLDTRFVAVAARV